MIQTIWTTQEDAFTITLTNNDTDDLNDTRGRFYNYPD